MFFRQLFLLTFAVAFFSVSTVQALVGDSTIPPSVSPIVTKTEKLLSKIRAIRNETTQEPICLNYKLNYAAREHMFEKRRRDKFLVN